VQPGASFLLVTEQSIFELSVRNQKLLVRTSVLRVSFITSRKICGAAGN